MAQKRFYLTFDGAVNLPNTMNIVAVLADLGVQATFFVEGSRIAGHEPQLRAMVAAGHHLGNHSFTHPDFDKIPLEDCQREISVTDEALEAAVGFRTMLVRPPCGILPDDRRALLENLGYKISIWTISVKDWLGPDADAVAQRLVDLAEADEVVAVLHDHLDWTPEVVQKAVPALQAKGYWIGPIPY